MRAEVQNPIPGLTSVAVVPFFNLTQEPNEVVDGRRFALAYFSELQKTSGFEVVPVGVTEAAILRNELDLRDPDDALKLAKILKVDAIVIGAVTDYDPYYPPRIGMQVDWYSPYQWSQSFDGDLMATEQSQFMQKGQKNCRKWYSIRGQSPDSAPLPGFSLPLGSTSPRTGSSQTTPEPPQLPEAPSAESVPATSPRGSIPTLLTPEDFEEDHPPPPVVRGTPGAEVPKQPDPVIIPQESLSQPVTPIPEPGFDPRKPLMSYTRLFDGAELELVNQLKDYLELRGDQRGGSWEASLHRSEDFIRFTSHMMIVEMLSLHGGSMKSQIVLKWRKYR